VIPALNEASRGFPFPLLPRVARLKEGLFTHPPNHVDFCSFSHAKIANCDGRHTSLFLTKKPYLE